MIEHLGPGTSTVFNLGFSLALPMQMTHTVMLKLAYCMSCSTNVDEHSFCVIHPIALLLATGMTKQSVPVIHVSDNTYGEED